MTKEDFRTYNCAGWATRYGVECSDGRTIEHGAFDHLDGVVVPVVWAHGRNNINNIIGKAMLKANDVGVRAYTKFNGTKEGNHAKLCVEHGDLDAYSIFAVNLHERGLSVKRGDIKEVSLVIAGANPMAKIDQIEMSHGDEADGSAIYYPAETIDDVIGGDIEHADGEKDSSASDSKSDDSKGDASLDGATIKDIYNGAMKKLSETEQQVLMLVFGEMLDMEAANANKSNDTAEHSAIDEGGNEMKVNAFEAQAAVDTQATSLQHAAAIERFALDGMREAMDKGVPSLRNYLEATSKNSPILQHSGVLDAISGTLEHAEGNPRAGVDYGITNIDILFPEATAISNRPEFINRRTEWVNEILTKTSHRPFAKIKSLFADITQEEARAKGYIKGDQKDDEVFNLLSRDTHPQTIYKENRLDRDDIIDATTIDVIAFLKEEMRIKYDEEVARAMLLGDGRQASDKHKIKEDRIRPVLTDDDLYTIKYEVEIPAGTSAPDKADIILDASVLSFEDYTGTGNTVMFIDPTLYRNMLVMKDDIGNRKYKSIAEIATAAGVNKILPCPYLKNLVRQGTGDDSSSKYDVHAITLDLSDYVFGSEKMGALSFFDDFDLNFNKMIYLMEGRMSGALVKPYSAIVLETKQSAG